MKITIEVDNEHEAARLMASRSMTFALLEIESYLRSIDKYGAYEEEQMHELVSVIRDHVHELIYTYVPNLGELE